MKRYISLLYFYKKIVIPAITVSCIFSISALQVSIKEALTIMGVAYQFLLPLMHYFIYEVGKPNEYYFYYNLGFSRKFLWITTVVSAMIVQLILRFV